MSSLTGGTSGALPPAFESFSNVELEREAWFAGLWSREHDFADRVCEANCDRQPVVVQA